jgi:nicotinate-nucleotide adenylyltransferase
MPVKLADIGIFGGTFDPVHIGHLIAADHVREVLGLRAVVFVPSSVSPHKRDRIATPGTHRLEMIARAIGSYEGLEVSDIEVRRGGVSYTVDTVEELRLAHPDARIALLIGADNLVDFSTWRDPDRILKMANLIVMTRPGHDVPAHPLVSGGKATLCAVPDIEVSASDIRARVREGLSIRYRVPPAVEEYILSQGLYRR